MVAPARVVFSLCNLLALASAVTCVVVAFEHTHRPSRTIFVTDASVATEIGHFRVLHPVYLAGIAQALAVLWLLLVELPGACLRNVAGDARLRLVLVKCAVVGVPLQTAALLALSDNAIIPFLGTILVPLALGLLYLGAGRLRNRHGHLCLMAAAALLHALSLTAVAVALYTAQRPPLQELRLARGVLLVALGVQAFVEWVNLLVHVQWSVPALTTAYVHSLFAAAGRFVVFWALLAAQQRDARHARNYLVVGAAGGIAFCLLLGFVPTPRGVVLCGRSQVGA